VRVEEKAVVDDLTAFVEQRSMITYGSVEGG
jgi:hypothetical protein